MRKSIALPMIGLSFVLGGGSLLAFLLFLYAGSWQLLPLSLPPAAALLLDAGLSLFFFLQHSGMIRGPLRKQMEKRVPAVYRSACYSIASGICLFMVLGLWQRIPPTIYSLEGLPAAGVRLVFFLPFIGFLWSARALDMLDPFGAGAIRRSRGKQKTQAAHLVVAGPYRFVRHPMYAGLLVLFWATPHLGLDRLVFNLLWSAWVVAGARMEEGDLLAAHGEAYRRYQKAVPMLLPYRLTRREKRVSGDGDGS